MTPSTYTQNTTVVRCLRDLRAKVACRNLAGLSQPLRALHIGGRQASDLQDLEEDMALGKSRYLGLLRDGKAFSTALLKINNIITATVAEVKSS